MSKQQIAKEAERAREIKSHSLEDFIGERRLRRVETTVKHPFDNDASGIAIEFDDCTLIAFEDPSDGYRSSLGALFVFPGALYNLGGNLCSDYIDVPVVGRMSEPNEYDSTSDVLELIDTRNGKVILQVGTTNSDDYYPSFVALFNPENIAGPPMTPAKQEKIAKSQVRGKLTEAQAKFLRELLRWEGVASPQNLGPQISQQENSARQTCKRRGWVTFSGGYWRITDAARAILTTPTHSDSPTPVRK